MIPVLATIFAVLGAFVHVYIFAMESLLWLRPRVWKQFGVPDQISADILRLFAFNQGFYNLFLAAGVAIGLVLTAAGSTRTGWVLVAFALGSMVAAAVVLVLSDRRFWRPAILQGGFALIGFVLALLA